MVDDTGARKQESLREHPALKEIRNVDRLVKGSISGIIYRDNPQNQTGQTLVHITLFGGYPNLKNVPLAVAKVNKENGVEWTPDRGDVVLVQFINGNWLEPVVVGFLNLPSNEVQADSTDAPPGKRRYHLRCNQTDIKILKDGTRQVYVAKDDNLEVIGNGSITVHGNVTVHIMGTANVTVDGNATVKAPQITLDTPETICTGNLTVNKALNVQGQGVSGNVTSVTGSINVTSGDVTVDGISSKHHTHSDPQGGTVGQPV